MFTNVDEFKRELEEESKVVETDGIALIRAVATDVLEGVIFSTKVATGEARANWQVTLGEQARGKISAFDKSGTLTFTRGIAAMQNLRLGQSVWITNNSDHILFLEHGTDQTSPQPMVGPTLAKVGAKYEGVI